MGELPFAEEINYWKTSKSTPDTWFDKIEAIIEQRGGEVLLRASGKTENRKSFLIDFVIEPEKFRIIWPVLPSKGGDVKAAERQAATLLFYDVKARALRASILGNRAGFFDFILLDSGKTVAQLSNEELNKFPKMLGSGE